VAVVSEVELVEEEEAAEAVEDNSKLIQHKHI
jgi:hypothetical protein